MIVGAGFPELASAREIERIYVSFEVAEINGGVDHRRISHAAGRCEGPVSASGVRVERINDAVGVAHKDASAEDRRGSLRVRHARKSEGPFEFEPGSGLAGEPSGLGVLKARVP